MTETRLDLRGLKCPLPVLRARKALAAARPGDVLSIECTDPLSRIDIPHMVRETGNSLEGQVERNGAVVFTVRKTGH